jgi:hypothetical protein
VERVAFIWRRGEIEAVDAKAGARFLIYPRPPLGDSQPPSGGILVPFTWCRDGVFDAANA